MPTPGERKALLFFALVGALGAGVRLSRAASSGRGSDAAAERALAAQRAAVDSAARADAAQGASAKSGTHHRRRGSAATRSPGSRGGAAAAVTPGSDAPHTGGTVAAAPSPRFGTPVLPPDPRRTAASAAAPLVDLDRASEAEIERLPRVGPALAKRIVAHRDSIGPYGSLEALREVTGVGPSLLEHLRGRVTFSAPARPPGVRPRPARRVR